MNAKRTFSAAQVVTLLWALLLLPSVAVDGRTIFLDELPIEHMTAGWGQAQRNLSIQERPLTIAGKTFQRGVGTHADSALMLKTGEQQGHFQAWVGVDDEVAGQPASIEFIVAADGQVVWESGVMRAGDPAKQVHVQLEGVERLNLQVRNAGDGINYDHANWADARFVISGPPPTVATVYRAEPYILTPPPPDRPRINHPRIYGASPGKPFLFMVPTSGERPMRFTAEGLPEGLAIDSERGIITGVAESAGTYEVTISATNAHGTDRQTLHIVLGDTLALTPHMGWNSWYVWETHVTDEIMRAAAEAMITNGMAQHGYQFVNIDDCWAVKPGSDNPAYSGEPRDAEGKVNANPRFPDMKALTDFIHARGLKAGIYTSPGPLTCAGFVGAWEHEQLDAERFAEWGFDFLKYDWCSYGRIAKDSSVEELQKPYRVISAILPGLDRDIVLNLCQYGMGDVWEWGRAVGGHSWRTAGDLGLSFNGIATALFRDGFDVYSQRELHKYGGPGGWNDPDYLLIGYLSNWQGATVPTPLTTDEQYSHVTLWALVAAPLILSGDITRLDDFTLSLLCNDEIIGVDQDPLGRPGRRIHKDGGREVWARELENGDYAIGLFNRDAYDFQPVSVQWKDLGLSGTLQVRDLWRQQDLGGFEDGFQTEVAPHGVTAIRVGFRPAGRPAGSLMPAGHQARSEVRSTASRAAARGLEAPCEVGGPLWVGDGGGLVDIRPADGG
ncbi:MAG: NPCBM/NEW2 domain-containing protein, partial [Verrucomicrobiota bacterium]|nr:NPCBM/NEW2 domain-containing protein [Verrucomicrobiota bacterium]